MEHATIYPVVVLTVLENRMHLTALTEPYLFQCGPQFHVAHTHCSRIHTGLHRGQFLWRAQEVPRYL